MINVINEVPKDILHLLTMKSMITLLRSYGVLKRLNGGIFLLLFVFIIGTYGYIVIEKYTLLDAMYMTMITVASVGYNEVHPLTESGKIFTSLLILLSVATYVYVITIVTSFIVEGEFRMYFKHLRVNKEINKLRNHVVVCGYGRNGRQACQQLTAGNMRYVVIENKTQIIEQFREDNTLFVEGNATKDEVLLAAGIKHAKALITTLPDDAANVFVVLTAHEMNPAMKIISRASNDGAESKLKRAGADNVIMPDKIGGSHMAALITKPDVLEFVDFITGRINIRIEEIHYNTLPEKFKNKSIGELDIRNECGANIIGYKNSKGEYIVNPSPDIQLMPDTKLFVLGTEAQVKKLFDLLFEKV